MGDLFKLRCQMVMNCRIYIFKQVIFPHCNIQSFDLHSGPAGSGMLGLAGYPGLLVYLALPGAGGWQSCIFMLCSNFHPAFLGLELFKCLYSQPTRISCPEPSYFDVPFKAKPSSCPALVVHQFIGNSY